MFIEGFGDCCMVCWVFLMVEQVKNFYYIIFKEVFWFIFYFFFWQFIYDFFDWDNFQYINCLFVEVVCVDVDDNVLFWVYDYNFWLVFFYICQFKFNVKIVFFYYIFFFSVDIFNILFWWEAIVESLLVCDFCGFYIFCYVENFVVVVCSFKLVEIIRWVVVD